MILFLVSFNQTLSHTVFALNEGARKKLCALLPPEVVSNIKPPSTQRASWEEDMPGELTSLYPDSDEMVQGETEEGWGNGEAFIRLCAIVLAKAESPALGGDFLYNLPLNMQASILHGVLTRSSLTCLRGLEGPELEFVEWVRQQLDTSERWGGQWAGDIMRTGSGQSMQCLLEELDGRDRSSALILQQHLFHFTDLLSLSGRDLQLVLSSESNEHIALVLQGISEEQVDQLLTQVSPRRQRLILEEAERYADAASEEITEACQAIISTARLLQHRHRITTFIPGSSKISGSFREEKVEIEAEETVESEGLVGKSKKIPPSPSRSLTSLKSVCLGIVVGLPLLWFLVKSDFNTTDSAKINGGEKQQWVIGGGSMKTGSQTQSAGGDLSKDRDSGRAAEKGVPGVSVSGDYRVESADVLGEIHSTGRVLFLRLGEVKAHIMEDNFSIQTPLIRVDSPVGSRYQVRVVLDATSEVRVEEGWVEVESVKKPGNSIRMGAGRVRTFTHDAWK